VVWAVSFDVSKVSEPLYWSLFATVALQVEVEAVTVKLLPALMVVPVVADGGVAMLGVVAKVTAPGRMANWSEEQPYTGEPTTLLSVTLHMSLGYALLMVKFPVVNWPPLTNVAAWVATKLLGAIALQVGLGLVLSSNTSTVTVLELPPAGM
jgi:hypothetical protein